MTNREPLSEIYSLVTYAGNGLSLIPCTSPPLPKDPPLPPNMCVYKDSYPPSPLSPPMQAACWSPKGDVLIFALEDDPSLYYLSFRGYGLAAGSTSAIKCADLAPCNVTTTDGEQIV